MVTNPSLFLKNEASPLSFSGRKANTGKHQMLASKAMVGKL